MKDIIIRGGENVSAAEVEQLLAHMEGVAEVAVVAAPDEKFGEHGCAFFRMQVGVPAPDMEAVRAHLAAAGLARQKWPEEIRSSRSCPGTPSGKVQKFVLREQLRTGNDVPAPLPEGRPGRGGCGEVRSSRRSQAVQAGQGWSYACCIPKQQIELLGAVPLFSVCWQHELRSITHSAPRSPWTKARS